MKVLKLSSSNDMTEGDGVTIAATTTLRPIAKPTVPPVKATTKNPLVVKISEQEKTIASLKVQLEQQKQENKKQIQENKNLAQENKNNTGVLRQLERKIDKLLEEIKKLQKASEKLDQQTLPLASCKADTTTLLTTFAGFTDKVSNITTLIDLCDKKEEQLKILSIELKECGKEKRSIAAQRDALDKKMAEMMKQVDAMLNSMK